MKKKPETTQGGSVLLEAMISILIFSFGVLGIVGLHASMISGAADAKYRNEAGFFANRLLGEMAASDRSSAVALATFQSPAGANYTAWLGDIQNINVSAGLLGLPGAVTYPPTVTITPNLNIITGLPTSYDVTVIVRWKSPGQTPTDPPHRHEVHASLTTD